MKPSNVSASGPHRTFALSSFRALFALTRSSACRRDRPGKRRYEANKIVSIAIAALFGLLTGQELEVEGKSTDAEVWVDSG